VIRSFRSGEEHAASILRGASDQGGRAVPLLLVGRGLIKSKAGVDEIVREDNVPRWRADMDRLEQERVQAKEQMKCEQERHERNVARAGAREEVAALRAELATLYSTLSDTMTATGEALRTLGDEARARREEVADLKLQVARLGASPEAKRAAFQFAREKSDGEVVDLPEFLVRKTMN
jgi:hypothetical protein